MIPALPDPSTTYPTPFREQHDDARAILPARGARRNGGNPVTDIYDIARTPPSSGTAWSVESVIKPEPWVARASCAEIGGDAWFPTAYGDHHSTAAKKVCLGCPVAAQCLEYALRTNQIDGIWAGTSPRERSAMRRRGGQS